MLNPLFPVYSSLSAVRQNCPFEYLPSSFSAGGSHPGWARALLGLSLSSLGLLLSPCPSKEQHGWQISSTDWRAKNDIRSLLTSWCPAQTSGSSSCTSPVPNCVCNPSPALPTWLNSKQDKGIKSPTNTQCLYDVIHAAPQEAHTLYNSSRRSAHRYRAKKCS